MAFYELRQYHIRPGKMADWLTLMEEEIIPFQASKGMVITASFRGETDDSVYIWLRRFETAGQQFLDFERDRNGAVTIRHAEIEGVWHLPTGFILKGRADRIDEMADGSVHILDFKTGSVPQPGNCSVNRPFYCIWVGLRCRSPWATMSGIVIHKVAPSVATTTVATADQPSRGPASGSSGRSSASTATSAGRSGPGGRWASMPRSSSCTRPSRAPIARASTAKAGRGSRPPQVKTSKAA